ncbi:MAG TPA: hypothetical protein VI728_08075 [Syntrophales bacterium]|nr:hypothetical protein [Syntrophales bacterium]
MSSSKKDALRIVVTDSLVSQVASALASQPFTDTAGFYYGNITYRKLSLP